MKRNITFFLFWKSGISLFICLILLTSCDLDTPESPNRTHPFDSYNPETHGDPFQLKAELVPEGVRLTWQPVEWPILISINILRQVDDEEFQTLDIVRATDTTYFDEDISNSHRAMANVLCQLEDGPYGVSGLLRHKHFASPVPQA